MKFKKSHIYDEYNKKSYSIRKFSKNIEEGELKWHIDLEDRIVIPLHENDWMFQRDNSLPEKIDKKIYIKANEWHRIIKGNGDLFLKVIKK